VLKRSALVAFVFGFTFAGCSHGGSSGGGMATAASTAPVGTGTQPTSVTPGTTTAATTSAAALGDPTSAPDALSGAIKDAHGRQLLLRGLNLSERSKHPPFAGWLQPSHVDDFVRFGMDHVRYLLTWEAVEPQDGVFDDAYLAQVATELSWFEARGIYVVLDMHQDEFARVYGGDGMPDWVLLSPDPYPWLPDVLGTFPINYANPKVLANFDDFWTNATKQARFAKAWAHVISKLSSAPNVIGYEILNEPFAGTKLPWDFEANELTPFEALVAKTMRAADPARMIFFEPWLYTAALPTTSIQKPQDPNVVYAPHWYDPVVDVRAAANISPNYDGDPTPTKLAFGNLANQAKGLGCPFWLGEFGIEEGRSGALDYVRDHFVLLDQNLMSCCYWELNPVESDVFSPVDPAGNDFPIAGEIAHPHPRAVAGTLTRVSYDPTTRELDVDWTEGNLGPQAPTLVELPAKVYGTAAIDVLLASDPAGAWHFERETATGRLAVWADPGTLAHTLVVRPH
jgi:endoglycosylceramidase